MNKTLKQNDMTRELLIKHYGTYPKLQIEDIFKYLFQSSFGCEHLVSCEESALAFIEREYEALPKSDPPLIEALDGEYSRVHLSYLSFGLKPEDLAKLFCLSAKKEPCGKANLEQKLQVAKELVSEGILPFDSIEFEEKLTAWRSAGYPAVHHSNAFREAYRPAYRVISNRYAIPLAESLSKNKL